MSEKRTANDWLNVIIVVILAIACLLAQCQIAYIYVVSRSVPNELYLFIGTIVGGLIAFLSHQVARAGPTSASVVAPSADVVNVSQPQVTPDPRAATTIDPAGGSAQ